MSALFDSPEMALGYARSRPPVHAAIIARAQPHIPHAPRALDIGCGAGLSANALHPLAAQITALDPFPNMLQAAKSIAPAAHLLAAQAEHLPFPAATFPLAAAAGSLNYTDFPNALAEIARVLTPQGRLLIYDFSLGRNPSLEPWLEQFHTRYPRPQGDAIPIDDELLTNQSSNLKRTHFEPLSIPLTLHLETFLNYILTETNVAQAISRGTPQTEIRAWCEHTLQPLFAQPQTLHFPAYFALLAIA